MDILKGGLRQTAHAPTTFFTGGAWVEWLVEPPKPSAIQAVIVTFAPGARTHWHTHPLGQMLHVTSGLGLVQTWGEKVREICAGDVVWIPPGERHWHGATPNSPMVHLAVQEREDGIGVEWFEEVTEAQYSGPRGA